MLSALLNTAGLWLPYMPLEAAIGQIFAPVSPRRMPWSSFLDQKLSCGNVKLLSKASVQKAQNRPSTQLIAETSCIEKLNTTITAKELS